VELEIDAVRSRVAAFEADMIVFFGRLDTVVDPAQFAALTSQMPEPPLLQGADEPLAMPLAEAPPAGQVAAAPPVPRAFIGPPKAAQSALPLPAEAPAAKTMTTRPAATRAPEAEVGATETFAPAPPEPSAPVASSGIEDAPEAPAARVPGAPVTTTVVVVGLVNIASIASFKRHVSGLHGVRSVAVSSSPGGEFVFKVTHEPDLALGDEVTLLPDFGARIVENGAGLLKVAARDPGAAA
jgi:hypothetical protein